MNLHVLGNVKVVATYSKPEEAHLAGTLLEANGISFAIQDENVVTMDWLYSMAVGGVKLEVAEEDFAEARELLNLPVEKDVILQCPHCGSGNTRMRELSLLAASFVAFLGFIVPARPVKVDCLDCGKSFKHKTGPHAPDSPKDET